MRAFSLRLGIAGLLLILLGALGYAVTPGFMGFYLIPWFLAAVCLFIYLLYNRGSVFEFLVSRRTRYGAGSALAVILIVGILALAAVLTSRHNVRYDLTKNDRYSLAPQTLKVLGSLKTEVKVLGFFEEAGGRRLEAQSLLEQYAYAAKRFKFELIDPDRNPALSKENKVEKYGTVIVRAGGATERITRLSEQTLTNALIKVTRTGKKVVYFLDGHGEKGLDDTDKGGFSGVKKALEDQNYEVKPLLLVRQKDVPGEADVLVAAGPRKDLDKNETEALERYLRQGGSVLFLIDPLTVPELVDFLKRFNVEVGDNLIIDQTSRLAFGDYRVPVVSTYKPHPVTENFTMFSFFPLARSVSATEKKAAGVKAAALALTGEQSWAETDLDLLAKEGRAKRDDKDLKGPVSVAVVGTVSPKGRENKKPETPLPQQAPPTTREGKFIVFGDSDFATNAYFSHYGNGDLFLSSVSWLAEEADLVSIRPREGPARPLMLTAIQARLVWVVPVVAIPLGVFLIGAFVLLSRWRSR